MASSSSSRNLPPRYPGLGAKRQRRGSAGVALELRWLLLLAYTVMAFMAGFGSVQLYHGLVALAPGSYSEARARLLAAEPDGEAHFDEVARKIAALPVRPAAREPVPPQTARLVVLTTQRSGSTFLCAELARRLWGHGFVTWSEPLIPQAWLDHGWRPADVRTAFGFDVEAAWPLYERRLEEAFEEALSIHREGFPARDHGAPAAVGFKVMDNQVPQPLWPRLLEYFRRRQVHVVQLVRVNGLEVFLSKADARARGQWHSYEAAKRAVAPHEVDRFALHYDLLLHRCSMGRMRAHLADGLAPERVRLLAYETLKAGGTAQVDAQVDAVLRFLGVDPAAAAGAAEVEGRRNWIAEHVPARMAASSGSQEDVCAGRVANWAEIAEMLAGSLELQLCAGGAGGDGLTEAEVAEGLGHLTTYGRREALPEALCAEKYDATFREACEGRPSTIHGCIDYFFDEVVPDADAAVDAARFDFATLEGGGPASV